MRTKGGGRGEAEEDEEAEKRTEEIGEPRDDVIIDRRPPGEGEEEDADCPLPAAGGERGGPPAAAAAAGIPPVSARFGGGNATGPPPPPVLVPQCAQCGAAEAVVAMRGRRRRWCRACAERRQDGCGEEEAAGAVSAAEAETALVERPPARCLHCGLFPPKLAVRGDSFRGAPPVAKFCGRCRPPGTVRGETSAGETADSGAPPLRHLIAVPRNRCVVCAARSPSFGLADGPRTHCKTCAAGIPNLVQRSNRKCDVCETRTATQPAPGSTDRARRWCARCVKNRAAEEDGGEPGPAESRMSLVPGLVVNGAPLPLPVETPGATAGKGEGKRRGRPQASAMAAVAATSGADAPRKRCIDCKERLAIISRVPPDGRGSASLAYCRPCAAAHRDEIKLNGRICEDCFKATPSFILAADVPADGAAKKRQARWCKSCSAGKGPVVNIKDRRCDVCKERMVRFGPPGGKAIWCRPCSEQMASNGLPTEDKRTRVCIDCKRMAPSWGAAGGKPLYCRMCVTKHENVVDVATQRCVTCKSKVATFGPPAGPRRWCRDCAPASPEAVSLVATACLDCLGKGGQGARAMGVAGGRLLWCLECGPKHDGAVAGDRVSCSGAACSATVLVPAGSRRPAPLCAECRARASVERLAARAEDAPLPVAVDTGGAATSTPAASLAPMSDLPLASADATPVPTVVSVPVPPGRMRSADEATVFYLDGTEPQAQLNDVLVAAQQQRDEAAAAAAAASKRRRLE